MTNRRGQLSRSAHAGFAAGQRVKAFDDIEQPVRIKLDRLEAATSVRGLAALPGNRLEAPHRSQRSTLGYKLRRALRRWVV